MHMSRIYAHTVRISSILVMHIFYGEVVAYYIRVDIVYTVVYKYFTCNLYTTYCTA